MTIFDLMTSQELTAYWEELVQDEAPYPCEELFPDDKKRGLELKWLKGAKGLPIVLKTSFEKLTSEMPYFKESTYIDEELRQELNMVLETGNQAYIDSVMNKIFDDEVQLLRGARASRERMRMMALTTGVVSMANNGQTFTYDYQVPDDHKVNAATAWSDHANSDPMEDIRLAKEKDADLVLATDPDADRLGVYVKDTKSGEYITLTGNMSGCLLAEYEISQKKELEGGLPADGALIKTIVTSNLADEIAKGYDIRLIEVLTGFKYIGQQILGFETTGKGSYLFGFIRVRERPFGMR